MQISININMPQISYFCHKAFTFLLKCLTFLNKYNNLIIPIVLFSDLYPTRTAGAYGPLVLATAEGPLPLLFYFLVFIFTFFLLFFTFLYFFLLFFYFFDFFFTFLKTYLPHILPQILPQTTTSIAIHPPTMFSVPKRNTGQMF